MGLLVFCLGPSFTFEPQHMATQLLGWLYILAQAVAHDKYFFGDAPRQDDAEMLRVGKDFLKKHGKDTRFILQMDRATSYGAYKHMQDLLMRIFQEVREEKAQSTYGKSLKELTPEELTQINDLIPLSISETDMKKG